MLSTHRLLFFCALQISSPLPCPLLFSAAPTGILSSAAQHMLIIFLHPQAPYPLLHRQAPYYLLCPTEITSFTEPTGFSRSALLYKLFVFCFTWSSAVSHSILIHWLFVLYCVTQDSGSLLRP